MKMLREMLIRHEGWRNKPYFCPAGARTIGVGWNMDAHKLPDDIASCRHVTGEITDEMVGRLLDISIGIAVDDCHSLYAKYDEFSEVRKAALADFMFNVGINTAFKFTHMRAAIAAQDWNLAADSMVQSAWYSQVGDRSAEIVGMVRAG